MTEPPFPPRQAVKPSPRKTAKQPKIINGVAYHGFSRRNKIEPKTAKHALKPMDSP